MGVEHVRDTSTSGFQLPEARTSLWQIGTDIGTIQDVVRTKRFCVVVGKSGLEIFPTDATSSAIVDTTQPPRRGSIPVQGTTLFSCVISFRLENILNVCISSEEQFLWAFTLNGVHVIDLASASGLSATLMHGQKLQAGCLVGDCIIFSADGLLYRAEIDQGVLGRAPQPLLAHMKGEWRISVRNTSSLVALVHGSDQLVLHDTKSKKVYLGTLSGGAVMSVGILEKTWLKGLECEGIYVHQRDAISLYVVNESNELDLTFQFRDTINKVQFDSVDVSSQEGYMLIISSESLNKRSCLELFDLGQIKPKCVSLQPMIRYDVSRLLVDASACKARFIRTDTDKLLDFVITSPEGDTTVGMVWECVMKEQWFSFMPNFKVLGRNEPYVEGEAEFDFNQEAVDVKTIQMTVSRYKPCGGVRLDFFRNGAVPFKRLKPDSETNETGKAMVDSSRDSEEPMYPFLQPIRLWTSRVRGAPVTKAGSLSVPAAAEFFSPACKAALKQVVE